MELSEETIREFIEKADSLGELAIEEEERIVVLVLSLPKLFWLVTEVAAKSAGIDINEAFKSIIKNHMEMLNKTAILKNILKETFSCPD